MKQAFSPTLAVILALVALSVADFVAGGNELGALPSVVGLAAGVGLVLGGLWSLVVRLGLSLPIGANIGLGGAVFGSAALYLIDVTGAVQGLEGEQRSAALVVFALAAGFAVIGAIGFPAVIAARRNGGAWPLVAVGLLCAGVYGVLGRQIFDAGVPGSLFFALATGGLVVFALSSIPWTLRVVWPAWIVAGALSVVPFMLLSAAETAPLDAIEARPQSALTLSLTRCATAFVSQHPLGSPRASGGFCGSR